MLDIEQKLKVFLSSAPSNVHVIQTLEIIHPQLPQSYHFWTEPYSGNTKDELGNSRQMRGVNFRVELNGSMGHLDQQMLINLDLTDSIDEFREAMDGVSLFSSIPVYVNYREYLSDNLDVPQSIAKMQVESVSFTLQSASFVVVSKRLNVTRTGETYNPKDIPMLRSFL